MVLAVQELWSFALPLEDREVEGPRSERIYKVFSFSNEFPEDWPTFVGHFERTADNMREEHLGRR